MYLYALHTAPFTVRRSSASGRWEFICLPFSYANHVEFGIEHETVYFLCNSFIYTNQLVLCISMRSFVVQVAFSLSVVFHLKICNKQYLYGNYECVTGYLFICLTKLFLRCIGIHEHNHKYSISPPSILMSKPIIKLHLSNPN